MCENKVQTLQTDQEVCTFNQSIRQFHKSVQSAELCPGYCTHNDTTRDGGVSIVNGFQVSKIV